MGIWALSLPINTNLQAIELDGLDYHRSEGRNCRVWAWNDPTAG
jgi:hypothetical protein